ncbi:hypothetical protein [Winogradskyella vidalii]|uniref:hypothetical protein n=1 Tax=Winogradskyella vidalii TaxID=2615024 RepID=UPI0015CC63C4|nr:hypothetical protein [Winogradskyella vidalii]
MKNIYLILLMIFLNITFLSCNPELIVDEETPQACCDSEEDLPPPEIKNPSTENNE